MCSNSEMYSKYTDDCYLVVRLYCTIPAVTAPPVRLVASRLVTREDERMERELHQLVSAAASDWTRVLLPDQRRILSDSGNLYTSAKCSFMFHSQN